MPTARLLALMLLVVAHAAAQDRMPNNVPRETRDDANPTVGSISTSAPPVSLPDAPVAHRVIDKKFIAIMAALGGAESLRFTTRKLVLAREFAAGAPGSPASPRTRPWSPETRASSRRNCS